MIDDELLQELLGKASGLYNNGDYRGAIAAWKEALAVDPTSQKAREGIQMATLLLADWDPRVSSAEGPAPAATADGAEASYSRLTPAQRAARLDEGVARVRALLRSRKYSEAIEGARGLVPIDPDSDEVQRLVDEAQQAFESAPFIEEHLTLARELANQERFAEAEAECRKVFALDPANPDALSLAAGLRARGRAAAAPADAGGVTMRMDVADLLAARGGAAAPGAEAGEPEDAAGRAAEPDAAAAAGGEPPEALDEPIPEFDLDIEPPSAEAPMAGAAPAEAVPGTEFQAPDEMPDATLDAGDGLDLEPPAAPAEAPEEEAFVDAETVVPPTVRVVPRTGAPSDSVEMFLEKTEDVESVPLAPGAPGTRAPGNPAPAADPVGWEEELESLNVKSGEHDLVGRNASLSTTQATPAGDEMDLSALLGDEMGEIPGRPDGMRDAAAGGPAPPETHEPSGSFAPDQPAAGADEGMGLFAPSAAAGDTDRADDPDPGMTPAAPPRARPRAAIPPMLFAVLGVVILAGAAAIWWFVYQPEPAAAQVAAPPAGGPPADPAAVEAGKGPIPTPLGSTSRQPLGKEPEGASIAAAGTMTPPAAPTAAAAPAAPAPAAPRPSPEDLRRQAAGHLDDGRRLMAGKKWQEARAALAAALALDPVNFECKEMLDQVNAIIDEETAVMRGLDEARRAFADKDYQGSLWKLYRLPRDPRLGDVNLYIRNAWFNWAVVGLKGGDATDARQKLGEVLSADPGDEEAKKLLDIAERYTSRAKDRVFYSFVDTLRFRAFDQK